MADESDFSVAPKVYSIAGYQNCSYYHDAVAAAEKISKESGGDVTSVTQAGWSRRTFLNWLEEQRRLGNVNPSHRSSPACFHGNVFEPQTNDGNNSDSSTGSGEKNQLRFIGGCDDFLAYVSDTYNNSRQQNGGGSGCTIC
jgi:hypothetical protein